MNRCRLLAFCSGVFTLISLKTSPPLFLVLLLLSLLVIVLIFWRRYFSFLSLSVLFLLGFSYALIYTAVALSQSLPGELEGRTIQVKGKIIGIPEQKENNIKFEFLINDLKAYHPGFSKLHTQLSWYSSKHSSLPVIKTGQIWDLTVKLKHPRGFWSPYSFDYQNWLFIHHIQATGYIINGSSNRWIGNANVWCDINVLREKIAKNVAEVLENNKFLGLTNALTTGIRNQITEDQWEVMRATGTNHLFAIAGLHIGFVAALFSNLVKKVWRIFPRLGLFCPSSQAVALIILIVSFFYSALAGFSLPTKRAILMLSIFLLATLFRRNISAFQSFLLALLIVILLNPFTFLDESLWLSFTTVGYIIFVYSGRLKERSTWKKWIHIQGVITISIIPLSLLFFQQISWIGLFANLVAIPWVGFVVLPLSLGGALISLINLSVSNFLLLGASKTLALLWQLLSYLAKVPGSQYYHYLPHSGVAIVGALGIFLTFLPAGFPARWLGIIGILPLILGKFSDIKVGDIQFALLDVGQGLAAVIRTTHHVLVYDTGPRFSNKLDAGSSVVIPFLGSKGIKIIDILMISHPDNDHIGGAASLLKRFPVRALLTSVPEQLSPEAINCIAGQRWEWDDVTFEVLYPPLDGLALDNDSSCVLRVNNKNYSILLTGDIERFSEEFLIRQGADSLKSTLLVVPHHGSKTSSSKEFVEAVHPKYALFPVGYQNRYHFPRPEVAARYSQIHALLYTTAEQGTIELKLPAKGEIEMKSFNSQLKFWEK